MTETPEERLKALGIELPTPSAPAANYVPTVIAGGMLYVSGQLPMGPSGLAFTGRLGDGVDVATGQEAARLCAINLLAQARAALGSLDRIAQLVKLTGFVAGTPDFTEPHKVINGASDLMVDALGDRGRHARAAVVAAQLPLGASVEVEAIFAIAE
ncbi:MAG: RidA family protein [Bauldia sp.]|nr:RidA family protein [Bauldia sp.]